MKNQNKSLLARTQTALIEGSAQNPIEVTVSSNNKGKFHTSISMRSHTIESDQPFGFEGTNAGPKPSELVLAALAACQETTWRIYAEHMSIPIKNISVRLKGIQDLRGFMDVSAETPAGFQKVEGIVTIESPASHESLLKLQKEVDAHCPVLDDLTRNVPVSFEVEKK